MTALEARGITVRFGHGHQRLTAVDHVDLVVPERTTVGLVGESGSGKSTLARSLVGLVPLAEGEVRLDDEPVRVARNGRVTDRRRRVQVIFQETAIDHDRFVADPTGEVRRVCDWAGWQWDRTLGALPLSRYTLTPPDPEKWRRYEAVLGPLLPGIEGTIGRARAAVARKG